MKRVLLALIAVTLILSACTGDEPEVTIEEGQTSVQDGAVAIDEPDDSIEAEDAAATTPAPSGLTMAISVINPDARHLTAEDLPQVDAISDAVSSHMSPTQGETFVIVDDDFIYAVFVDDSVEVRCIFKQELAIIQPSLDDNAPFFVATEDARTMFEVSHISGNEYTVSGDFFAIGDLDMQPILDEVPAFLAAACRHQKQMEFDSAGTAKEATAPRYDKSQIV